MKTGKYVTATGQWHKVSRRYSLICGIFFVISSLHFSQAEADSRFAEKVMSLTIKTVDEQNRPFKVQTVRWWYVGKRDQKHELRCATGKCEEWRIDEALTGSIVIHADTSIVRPDDKECWDLYAGQVVVEKPTRSVMIRLTHTDTVCKTQNQDHVI